MFNEQAQFSAVLIQKLGRKNGHTLGDWELADTSGFRESLPIGVDADPRPRLVCAVCPAYAVMVTDAGAVATSPEFEKPCTAPRAPSNPEAA